MAELNEVMADLRAELGEEAAGALFAAGDQGQAVEAAGGLSGKALERKRKVAWELFKSLENQVKVADQKVQAIFGANTLLVAAISLEGTGSMLRHGSGLAFAAAAARVLLLAAIFVSALSAIFALFPRLKQGPHARPRRSPLFFNDIAATPHAEFLEEFRALSHGEKVDHILSQVHAVAGVVREKYKWTRRAGAALVTALGLWVVIQLLAIAGGK